MTELVDPVFLALAAYRAAVRHERAVEAQWAAPRGEELRRLDEFHRTRVAWENAATLAEWLREEAADTLLAVARGDRPLGWTKDRLEYVTKSRNRSIRAVLAQLRSLHEDGEVRR